MAPFLSLELPVRAKLHDARLALFLRISQLTILLAVAANIVLTHGYARFDPPFGTATFWPIVAPVPAPLQVPPNISYCMGGPENVIHPVPPADGCSVQTTVQELMAQAGDLRLALIQPTCTHFNMYTDALPGEQSISFRTFTGQVPMYMQPGAALTGNATYLYGVEAAVSGIVHSYHTPWMTSPKHNPRTIVLDSTGAVAHEIRAGTAIVLTVGEWLRLAGASLDDVLDYPLRCVSWSRVPKRKAGMTLKLRMEYSNLRPCRWTRSRCARSRCTRWRAPAAC